MRFLLVVGVCLPVFFLSISGQTVAPLLSRGYTVLPAPQKVILGAHDFTIGPDWRLELDPSVDGRDVAVEALRDDLAGRFHLRLSARETSPAGVVSLRIASGTAQIGQTLDQNKHAIESEAYRIDLGAQAIRITANASTGLFYGVETLVQLIRPQGGRLWLPQGSIEDWPDLHLRHIYWDDAHHLERMDELKRAVRQAAFYKINGFTIKLEGHFQYKSAPALVEPYALTPAELQELTNYGLRYHVQLIPYLDAPAHIAFILKHPEYAKLREFEDSNYELCATNPDSYKLLEGMFQDLLDANKGVSYFYLSTDEPYYIGLADNAGCHEAVRARQLGSTGKLFAEFAGKAGTYLHDRGRTVFFWGEYPMRPDDLSLLPSFLVNGEVYGPEFDRTYRQHGIRQMIYTSSEGEEKLFPDYFITPVTRRLHGPYSAAARVQDNFEKISFDSARKNADVIGEVNAGWADMGLHPETFWLGYVSASSAGWHPGSPTPGETMSTFYPLFYGPDVRDMDRVYQLMSEQAQFWTDSWERTESTARKLIWGNSNSIYNPRKPAHDQILPLPPAPGADLSYRSAWTGQNRRRTDLAEEFLQANDVLLGLLYQNLRLAAFNQYNLEVYLAIARLCRQNLQMIKGIRDMDEALTAASKLRSQKPKEALTEVDRALDLADSIWRQRNQMLQDATATWYESWLPRVAEANGRKFLHQLDDVKDHLPDRTVDMSYLVYREMLLPFGSWVKAIADARNQFAAANHWAVRQKRLPWDRLAPIQNE
jgi:hypothetical protein